MENIILSLFCLFSGLLIAQPAQKWTWTNEAEDKDEVSIILLGDTNLQNRENPASAFQYILPTLQNADIRFCNLEGALAGTDMNANWGDVPHKFAWRHSAPEMVEGLVAAGFDVVGVANNVTYPYTALQKSLKVLEQAGIQYVGGGNNLAEAHKAIIIERKGTKIGFLQYACTVFPFDHAALVNQPGIAEVKIKTAYQAPENLDKPAQPPVVLSIPDAASLARMQEDIKALKKEADIVIASYHWGVSNTYEPVSYQKEVARAAIEAGADLIFGHGPHKLQAVEMWQNRPIFYSVGNSVFDWWKGRPSLDGMMVRLLAKDKKLQQISFVPLQRNEQNDPILYEPSSNMGQTILKNVLDYDDIHRARLNMVGKEVMVYDADAQERIPKLERLWEMEGLQTPESIVYDAERNVAYVSNMSGKEPGDGFIAKIDIDGKIRQLKWVVGLDNPKGMELYQQFLYVNDEKIIYKIDVTTGKIVEKHQPIGAVSLNDITVDKDGTVFANDMNGHQIFRLKNGKSDIFWQDRNQGRPNGIWNEPERLLIAMFGTGQFLAVDKHTRKSKLLTQSIGRGDGIEGIGEKDYLITDYTGQIFYFSPIEHLHLLLDSRGQRLTADLEYVASERLVLVPSHANHTIQAFRLVWEDEK